jgi:succinate-semialdehyde dehydrogenase/glutarate-semialdehyde dehydrogenase
MAKAKNPSRSNAKAANDDRTLIKTHAYIDGAWKPAKGKKTFAVTDPADGSVIARVPDCGIADAEDAIRAAKAAFPAWKALLPKQRADLLKRWYTLIMQNQDTLARILSRENGKPLKEAMGEVAYGASFIEWFAEEARRLYGRTVPPFKADARTIVTREAVGVCAAITPWNFPNAMITRKVGPALAAGCTMILKPPAETPLSALALAALAEEAGIPKGVFNVVTTTASKEIGRILSTHPDIAKLSFTGSTEVGRALMAQCAPSLKRVSLELGGNAPFIVFDDADLNAAVNSALQSKFRNSGQTCVCANRIYVQKGIYDRFTASLLKAVAKMKTGGAFEDGVSIGPLINQKGLKKVQDLVADAKTKGARVVTGGAPDKRGGLFYQPTILTNAKPSMKMASTEIFGPVAALYPFKDEEDAIRQANDTEYGLAAYVCTRDLGRAFRMSERLQYGIIGINEGIISSESAPFGGIKQSGFGREGGLEGIEEYTSVKYALFGGL